MLISLLSSANGLGNKFSVSSKHLFSRERKKDTCMGSPLPRFTRINAVVELAYKEKHFRGEIYTFATTLFGGSFCKTGIRSIVFVNSGHT